MAVRRPIAAAPASSALTFSYTVAAGQNAAALAATAVNLNGATVKDGSGNAATLSLTGLTQTGPQIDTTTPVVETITDSPSSGDITTGKSVTLKLDLGENVTVNTSGGTPTLTLNDGGTATYTSGSGTDALTFTYTVAAGQETSALVATAVNLNGATIADGAGNAANLSLTGLTQSGPQINETTPTISSITESPSGGDVSTGNSVTLTLSMNEVVTVNTSGGTPTLTLNDGETATYVSGSGTNALTFAYTVGAADAVAALAATAVNLNGATITDGSGDAANLSLTGLIQSGPQINTPVGTWYNQSFPTQTNTFTVTFDATPSQLGSDIVIGLGPAAASAYTGLAAIVRFNSSNTIDVRDGSAYNANVSVPYTAGTTYQFSMVVDVATDTYSVYVTSQGGSQIALATNYSFRTEQATATSLSDLTEYTDAGTVSVSNFAISAGPANISSLVESPSSGDLDAGKTVTLTLDMSENVTVNTTGGTPTLTLNDGSTATYKSGSGTSALVFSYTVAAGQNAAALAATAVNLNGATITDGSGNAANLSLTGLTQSGPQIDTTTPAISAIGETPSSGDLNAGKTVTYTVTMNEAVTVNTAGGSPTLSLNDGGTATYVSGSDSSALVFSYTVLAGQNTPDLQVSAVNLNGATIADGAGNAASLSLTGLAQGGPQVDTTPPTVSSVVESPASGDLAAGATVTLMLAMSEVVAVNTTGGSPTLQLNDGATATYEFGSGTNALTFSYVVAAGQYTASDLAVSQVLLNGATIEDGAGNAANLSLTGLTQTGPQIDGGGAVIPVTSNGETVTATDDKITNLGVNYIVTVNGANDLVIVPTTITGATVKLNNNANTTVDFSAGSQGTVTGTGNYVDIAGTGASVAVSSETVNMVAGVSSTITGSNNTINETAAGDTVTATGSNNVINVTSTGDALNLSNNAGDTVIVYAGAQATVTDTGDAISTMTVQSGSTATGAMLSGIQYDYGTVSGTTVDSGGYQFVEASGAASGTTLSGGYQYVYGSASGTVLSSGGFQDILAGGSANSTTINSGGVEYDYGAASGTTLSGGSQQYVFGGGSASQTVVSTGGFQDILAGGTASSATINSGGNQYDFGTASSTTVDSGGYQFIEASGTASGTTLSGGYQYVNGSVSGTVLSNGGFQDILAGGTANSTTINSGGIQYDYGAASGTTLGGSQYVYGSASGTVVSSGGVQDILAGGTASSTTIDSGGYQVVDAGGTISGATISGGTLELQNGANTGGSTIDFASGGLLKLDGTGTYNMLVADLPARPTSST